MPEPTERDTLEGWARFIRAESHVFSVCPELVWQQAANQPAATAVGARVSALLASGRAPARTWLARVPICCSPHAARTEKRPAGRAATQTPLLTLAGDAEVTGVAVSPDGRFVASVSAEELAGAKLWDRETGEEVRTFWHPPASRPVGLTFTPDCRRLVIAYDGQGFLVWDVESGAERIRQGLISSSIRAVAVSGDGQHIIGGVDFRDAAGDLALMSNGLAIYEGGRGRLVRLLGVHDGNVTSLLVCGGRVVSASDEGTIKVWDPATGSVLHVLRAANTAVNAIATGPDGSLFVSAGADGSLRLWDVEDGAERRAFGPIDCPVTAVAISPNGRTVVSGALDGTIRTWDLETGALENEYAAHALGMSCLTVTPDGRQIVSGGKDTAIRMWDLNPGEVSPASVARGGEALEAHRSAVFDLALAPDGKRLASLALVEPIAWWDLDEQRTFRHVRHEPWAYAVAWMPDGRSIVSAGQDHTLRIWDVASGECRMTLAGHESEVHGVTVTPGLARVVSWGTYGPIRVWDGVTGAPLPAPTGLGSSIIGVAAFPDGRRAAVVSHDALVIFDLWDCTEVARCENFPQQTFRAVAVSPDGRRLVTGGWANRSGERQPREAIAIWNVDPLNHRRFLTGHAAAVIDVVWMSDGHRIVSTSEDGTIAVWDAQTGVRITRWVVGSACRSVVTSDRRIIVGDSHGHIHLFDVCGVAQAIPADRA